MPHQPLISLDYSLMLADRVGESGLNKLDLAELWQELPAVKAELLRQQHQGLVGFFSIPERHVDLRRVEKLAREVMAKYRTLIVIGIGGSNLGARAVVQALQPAGRGMDIRFIGANTDPEEIDGLLRDVDLKRSVLNIISKSGDTIEPMSSFFLLRERLIRAVGEKRHRNQVIATTDATAGTLRQIAEREGYRTLPVPRDIGGRYSALTPVGLFPAACAGIPIRGLLAGAAAVLTDFERMPVRRNLPLIFAGLHHLAYAKRYQHVTVMMPYAAGLKDLAAWFAQLWAESLGKRCDRQGKTVHQGLTPIAALGATDQHSQIQLFNEGSFDKVVDFIEVTGFRSDFRVPGPYPDLEGAAYLAGHRFSEIIHAERQATALSLAKHGRTSITLTIPKISPQTIGGLMFFFQLATAAMGELLNVDVYDQPGVEAGKRLMYGLLGRRDYSPES